MTSTLAVIVRFSCFVHVIVRLWLVVLGGVGNDHLHPPDGVELAEFVGECLNPIGIATAEQRFETAFVR